MKVQQVFAINEVHLLAKFSIVSYVYICCILTFTQYTIFKAMGFYKRLSKCEVYVSIISCCMTTFLLRLMQIKTIDFYGVLLDAVHKSLFSHGIG